MFESNRTVTIDDTDSRTPEPSYHPRTPDARLSRYADFDRVNGAYLDWQLEQIQAYVGECVLEIGCGVGGILQRLQCCRQVHSLDVEPDVLIAAEQRFRGHLERSFELLDISTCSAIDIGRLQDVGFDTILAINVLEHIQDDVTALQRAEMILRPGGNLLLLVPAHPWLYGEYDRLDGHFRRYSKSSLKTSIGRTGFSIRKLKYFNLAGAMGWWLHYRVLKRKMHGQRQFGLMNRLIPLLSRVEGLVPVPFGLSVVAVLQKPLQ